MTEKFMALAVFALIGAPAGVSAQTYMHLQRGAKIAGEQSYILPQATFVVEVPLVTMVYERGPEFVSCDDEQLKVVAGKYGVNPKIYNELKNQPIHTTHEIPEDSIKISVIASPDHSKIFYVSPRQKWNKNQSVTFTYGADGMLSEGESFLEDKTFDIVVKGVSGLVSIVGSFFKSGVEAGFVAKHKQYDIVIKDLDDIITKANVLESQTNIDIYKDLKATLDKRYAKTFANYFYAEKKKITVVKILYTPDAQTAHDSNLPFFKLDKSKGLISFSNNLKNNIWGKKIKFDNVASTDYQLVFKKVNGQQTTYYDSRPGDSKGFAFNIPEKTELELRNGQEIVFQEIYKVPQFGIIGYVDTRKEKLTFSLDPVTGELKKMSITGKAILTDQVAATSALATETITAVKGDSEDAKLEKEVKRLENEKKKRDLLQELEKQ